MIDSMKKLNPVNRFGLTGLGDGFKQKGQCVLLVTITWRTHRRFEITSRDVFCQVFFKERRVFPVRPRKEGWGRYAFLGHA